MAMLIRYINLFFALIAIAGCLYYWHKTRMPAMFAPISWLVNLSAFYIARILQVQISVEWLNIWSGSIHLHACILVIAALLILGRKP